MRLVVWTVIVALATACGSTNRAAPEADADVSADSDAAPEAFDADGAAEPGADDGSPADAEADADAAVDPHAAQCRPCADSGDCTGPGGTPGSRCEDFDGAGWFCLTPCGAGCAAGDECVGGFCYPGSYTCDCVPGFAGVPIRCYRLNGDGLCRGQRTCDGSGVMSACDAPVPAAERCNGLDDDCDGTTDEDCAADADADGEADGDVDADADAGCLAVCQPCAIGEPDPCCSGTTCQPAWTGSGTSCLPAPAPDPSSCPAAAPTPRTACDKPGLVCGYGMMTVCRCDCAGWECAY
jgi:hypothetical protein